MPLAIELAAARLAVLSPPEILTGLRQRFQLLRGRDPSAPARQRTMQGLLDWDYELLSTAEQVALARLSVFAASFNLRAASAAVGHGDVDPDDVPDLVWSLSDKSLVTVERTEGSTRYRLLETVRVYADAKLRDSEDGHATHVALAEHYLDHFPPRMRGQREWIDGVALELDTMVGLVAALARSAPDAAYGLAWVSNDHRSTTGHFELARAEAAAILDGEVVASPTLARLLAHTAGLNASAGNLDLAESRLARAQAILDEVGDHDRWGKVTTTGGATTLALYRRDRASLLDVADRIEREMRTAPDASTRADGLWWLSMVRNALGEGDEIALATEAVELSRESGDYVALVGALCAGAEYALRAEDEVLAATYQQEAMRLSAELKIDVYLAFSFILAARMAQDRAQPEAAVELHSAADVILERIGFTLMPDDRQLSDEMLAAARGAVGGARARELETQGRALPLDQAVEMADRRVRPDHEVTVTTRADELVGDAVEEIGLADHAVLEVEAPHDREEHAAPTDDDVGAIAAQPRVVHAVGERLGGESAEHVLGCRTRQHEAMDGIAVVLDEPDLDRSHRRDRAARAEERGRVPHRRASRGGRRRDRRRRSRTRC